jgi:hypothetical protein
MTNPLVDMPNGEPSVVVAGDTWAWKRTDLFTDFPPATYTLTYALKLWGSTTAGSVITAAEVGNEYQITVAAAATALYATGGYRWEAYATRQSDGARVRVGFGQLVVTANLAVTTDDIRSHAQTMLDAIEALLEGRATKDVNSMSIKDRSLTKMTVQELMDWRKYYAAEVNRQKIAERRRLGKSTGRTMAVRFRS